VDNAVAATHTIEAPVVDAVVLKPARLFTNDVERMRTGGMPLTAAGFTSILFEGRSLLMSFGSPKQAQRGQEIHDLVFNRKGTEVVSQ
jgi:hypothetical protein